MVKILHINEVNPNKLFDNKKKNSFMSWSF